LTRRGFLVWLLGAALGATGSVEAATRPRQLSFAATGAMSVATATLAYASCQRTSGGQLFTRVGSIAGNLQYLVNNRLILAPAVVCRVKRGDVITWRLV